LSQNPVLRLDDSKLKVAREVKPGEEFTYVFDGGDEDDEDSCVE
jgi:hypothetical protein